tara:strand:- start:63139 stop:63285 length:147 start_codon:yes stop_codon:yes gene_type:complete
VAYYRSESIFNDLILIGRLEFVGFMYLIGHCEVGLIGTFKILLVKEIV